MYDTFERALCCPTFDILHRSAGGVFSPGPLVVVVDIYSWSAETRVLSFHRTIFPANRAGVWHEFNTSARESNPKSEVFSAAVYVPQEDVEGFGRRLKQQLVGVLLKNVQR